MQGAQGHRLTIRLAFAAILIGLSVGACGTGPSGTVIPAACPLSETSGVLTADGDRLGVGHQPIRWPDGWNLREDTGRLVIEDQAGTTRAGAGDLVRLPGGNAGDAWIACPDLQVLSPASPVGASG
jgi:hypothetical protein